MITIRKKNNKREYNYKENKNKISKYNTSQTMERRKRSKQENNKSKYGVCNSLFINIARF